MQIPSVDAHRHGGHPAQRTRDTGADQVRAEQRTDEREYAAEDERARHAFLSVGNRGERLSDADHDAAGERRHSDQAHGPLEQAQTAHVGERQRGIAVGHGAQARGKAILLVLLGDRLVGVGWPSLQEPGTLVLARSPGTSAKRKVELSLNGWPRTYRVASSAACEEE